MKKTKLTRSLLAACSVVALSAVMYGCTSDGAENDLVATQEVLDQTDMSLDDANERIDELEGNLETVTGERDTALERIGSADNADSLLGMLAAATARIGSADDADSLLGMLAAANAQIGSPDDPDSLMGMLAAEQAEVTRLSTLLGDENNPDPDSVRGMLAAANTRIGSADDPDSLLGMIAALNGQIGSPDDPDSLMGMIAGLNGQIGSADDPDSLLGMIAAEQEKVRMLTEEIDGDGTDENPGLKKQLADALERIKQLLAGTDPEQIGNISGGGSDIATDARGASDDAGGYADEAEGFDDNRATIQTEEANSVEHAMNAREHANTADTKATEAEDAAGKAAEATSAADANKYIGMAEDAKKAAEEAMGMAKDERDEAYADSMIELKIDDTMKSVGDVSIDADAPNNRVTTGTGADRKTEDTGLQEDDNPDHTVVLDSGQEYVPADTTATPPTAATPYRQAVATRTFDIGKVVDSADDMARLTIVTQYAGSKNVKVFAYDEADPGIDSNALGRVSTTTGKIITALGGDSAIGGTEGDADTTANLRSLGAYYLAGGVADTDGLAATDVVTVGDDTEPLTVYSYVSTPDNPATPEDDTELTYLVLDSQRTEGGTTVYIYREVDILAPAAADGDDTGTDPDEVQVTASIPEATDYNHIHFGVWAALDEDGESPSGHGIGFVQNFSAGGMTAVMPNFGDATYNGNWVATVQAADPDGNGPITLQDGTAMLVADWEDGDITVTLTDLAVLEGDITGNAFSGDDATVDGTNTHNLTADADFTGEFSGAFFGNGAAEAGGVFDFGSDDDNEDGAFRGAFGGAR